jgi:hypothetical protein
MRLRLLLVAASLAFLACSSEEPRPADPSVVENVPGSLVITTPERASFVDASGHVDGTIAVRGTGATKSLVINGGPAKVSADGSFEATIDAHPGLNLIVASDGESRLELPFVYGEFSPADRPVAQALAIDIGPQAWSATAAPSASLTTIVNAALEGRDLIASLRGKSFGGNALGSSWKFDVTLAAAAKGPGVAATAKDLVIEGTMELGSLSRPVRIRASEATISGVAELSLSPEGALGAAMPTADVDLPGFRIESGNGTIDTVASVVLRPIVENAVSSAVRDMIPGMVKLTLDGLGLPKELDLSAAGLAVKVPLATRFDGVAFDANGGTLTVATMFGNGATAGKAPGWLKLAGPFTAGTTRPTGFGASFSIDAVNQLLFAAWATGSLSFGAQGMKLSPALPPLVQVTGTGNLEIALGEVLVQRDGEPKPMCAVSILQHVDVKAEADALVLAPNGDPTISITWLVGGGGILDAIAEGAKGQLTRVLKPFRVPLPKVALDKLGPGFAGQSLAVTDAKIAVDRRSARVTASGAMSLVR